MWSGNNRAPWHDYKAKAIYHITLLKREGVEPFGRLSGDPRIEPGKLGSSYILASPIGTAIKTALKENFGNCSSIRLYQYALMPDHLHLILAVSEPLDETLGRKIAAFKVAVNKLSGIEQVFQKGFNDQIIGPNRSLNSIFRYLRENAHRLAVRHSRPSFFKRLQNIQIGGHWYNAYGNLHLMLNPFKEHVFIPDNCPSTSGAPVISRWLHCAVNGGILVSPFTTPEERALRLEAENLGGRIILLTNKNFSERDKPTGHDFRLCEQGRLLILTPLDPNLPPLDSLQYSQFINALASEIASSVL